MSAQFIKPKDIQWRHVSYLRRGQSDIYDYELILPEPLASWDVYDDWEKERIWNMRVNLKRGQILFDIGTESGWCNLVYADMVGPENMVLIEPTKEFWPNIYHTWYKNLNKSPRAFYDGLFSNRTNDKRKSGFTHWPKLTKGPLIDRNKYQYIHDNEDKVPEITLDDYVKRSGVVPDALTMDTEGSELLILKGAEKTLKHYMPLLWVSIHPDLAERDYKVKPGQTEEYLLSLGYSGKLLGIDHEEHWFFFPNSHKPFFVVGRPLPKLFEPLQKLKKPTSSDFYQHCKAGHAKHETKIVQRTIGYEELRLKIYDWQHYFKTVDDNETIALYDDYCTGQDIISYCIDRQGIWEASETKLITDLLNQRRIDDVVIDVGSHIGYYSLLAAKKGYQVAALDGSPENLELLETSAVLNNVASNVHPYLCWLDDEVAILPSDVESVHLLKVDVEGAEPYALRMASELIMNNKVRYAIFEISPTFNESYPHLVEAIVECGYDVYKIPPNNFGEHQENYDLHPFACLLEHCEIRLRGQELRRYVANLRQENFLFVRKDAK